ncbi:MAG: Stk1 family PASTA domain-containing Ser/Thr kinase [Actinomycetota bacterium]
MNRTEAPTHVAGRYVISGRIGSGGMGDVFKARDSVLGRIVALKMLPFDLAVQPGFVDRFRAEAQAIAKISHPNVVQVHDWGQEDETYYMVMEYVRGKNLRQVLSTVGLLHPKQAAQITGQVLGALAAAHDNGVIHRDVKPENVVVATDGRVKVMDFGIARALERSAVTSGLMGTVAYVAPEQASGEATDARADIYSTGCMLYELLTGSLPFEGDAAKVLHQHLHGRVPAPSKLVPAVGSGLDRIVSRATAPAPDGRYPSAGAMRKELARVMGALPAAPPLTDLTSETTSEAAEEAMQTLVPRPEPKRKRRFRPWMLALLATAIVGGGLYAAGPTRVPELAGLEQAGAEERIGALGLDPVVQPVFSDEAVGTVVSTDPAGGSWTRRGEDVAVEVSRGPRQTDVPSVVGLQLEQAEEMILEQDLTLGEIAREHSLEPVDKVLSQEPGPGRRRSGEPVSMIVSSGPAILAVPEVVNRSAAEAQKLLGDLGFVVSKQEVFHAAAPGTVVSQDPVPTEELPQGTEVILQVSKGQEPFAVPDVKGKACSDAKGQLEGLGMTVNVQSAGGGAADCAGGPVLEQDPLPESHRTAGDEATLYVG